VASLGGLWSCNAEHPVVFCLTLSLFLSALVLRLATLPASAGRARQAAGVLLLNGLCIGTIPYTKLQGVPFVPLLVLYGLYGPWRVCGWGRSLARWTAALFVGLVLPTLILISTAAATGFLADFLRRYVLGQAAYAGRDGRGLLLHLQNAYVTLAWFFNEYRLTWSAWFLLVALLMALLALRLARSRTSRVRAPVPGRLSTTSRRVSAGLLHMPWFREEGTVTALLMIPLAGVSLVCLIVPGNFFPHYLVLVFPPFLLLLGALFCSHWRTINTGRLWRSVLVGLYLAFGVTVPLFAFGGRVQPLASTMQVAAANSPGVDVIRAYVRPGEPMGVWGLVPHLNVLSQTVPATKTYAHQVSGYGDAGFYLREYAKELSRSAAPAFFNAVASDSGKYMRPAAQYDLWLFDDLRSVVGASYRFVERCVEGDLYLSTRRYAERLTEVPREGWQSDDGWARQAWPPGVSTDSRPADLSDPPDDERLAATLPVRMPSVRFSYWYVSRSVTSTSTGRLRSPSFAIGPHAVLKLNVLVGPDPGGQALSLEVGGEVRDLIGTTGHRPALALAPWLVDCDLGPYAGEEGTIVATDSGAADDQWLAFSQPLLLRTSNGARPAH